MQPTTHRPNWDDPRKRGHYENRRAGLGAVVALIAIILIAAIAMTGGDDSADNVGPTTGDPAVTETVPTTLTEPTSPTSAP